MTAVVNQQVRVGEGVGGTVVVLGCWCPTCKAEVGPSPEGRCPWCGRKVLDEDALSAREMLAQLRGGALPEREPGAAVQAVSASRVDSVSPQAPSRSGSAPRKTRPRGWWTQERYLAAIGEFVAEHGRLPKTSDFARSRGGRWPDVGRGYRLFGSWPAVLDAFESSGGAARAHVPAPPGDLSNEEERDHGDRRGTDARVPAEASRGGAGAGASAPPDARAGVRPGPEARVELGRSGDPSREDETGAMRGLRGSGDSGTPHGLHEASAGDVAVQDSSREGARSDGNRAVTPEAPPDLEAVRQATLRAVNALFDLLDATELALGAAE